MGRGLDGYLISVHWHCVVLKARERRGLYRFPVAMARGKHLFPFRTEPLSPSAPMVLGSQGPGRVGRRRFFLISTPLRPPDARGRCRARWSGLQREEPEAAPPDETLRSAGRRRASGRGGAVRGGRRRNADGGPLAAGGRTHGGSA